MYKVHYATQPDFADAAAGRGGKSWPTGTHDPPLMFNIRADPSETKQINPKSAEFAQNLATVNAARAAHLASIIPVCSQNKANACGGSGGPGPYGYHGLLG